MRTEDIEKSISKQSEKELIAMIDEFLSRFETGIISSIKDKLSIDRIVKVYKEEKLRMDEALEKYINNKELFYESQRGGYKLSDEHKKKISESRKGRRLTEEEKERHRQNSQRREVFQYDLYGNLVKVWASTREAGRFGFNSSYISKVCRNGKEAYGYLWKYKPLGEGNENVRIETITKITATT